VSWPGLAGTDAALHSNDAAALAELGAMTRPRQPERLAALLESRLAYALAALVAAVAILAAALRWGVPAAADFVVARLPVSLEATLGTQTLAAMDKTLLAPSRLAPARQQSLRRALAQHCAGSNAESEQSKQSAATTACPPYTLHFRDGKRVGANAFALPGGGLVLTDQLVKLARHDDEILGVLAHELGHVQRRHGVRLALQSLGAGVVLIAITGDLGSLSDAAAGLPAVLLRAGYSRDMEREADAYALARMQQACIAPARYVALLERLNKRTPTRTGLLDSHPGTIERLAAFRGATRPAHCP
jgi:Zn-dependent protease with chaperone function